MLKQEVILLSKISNLEKATAAASSWFTQRWRDVEKCPQAKASSV